MAGLSNRAEIKRLFPIKDFATVLALFKYQLSNSRQPNLALLSIVVGAVENQLTSNRTTSQLPASADGQQTHIFPTINWQSTEALYSKFTSLIKGSVDLSEFKRIKYANRELVKKVSDVVWGSLTRSFYKDRAHLQSLYSYLTGNKLDCFGVAFAVVAACQVLGFNDVHLALSEDHAWVVFGEEANETAEVTWHGKGNEDKRGQSITIGIKDKAWLYLNAQPIICTRHMEVAAMVSGINPSTSATTDSTELSSLQQKLLWMLYDMNHLAKYPMALGNLGDLEEICPTVERQSAECLFKEAILSAKKYYHNKHVYPYTYLGGFLFRSKRYKEALQVWANAAHVIRYYNYSREDEEIYKEFLEIANELIPNVMKISADCVNHQPLLADPECFSYLLQFYDGLCEWEEDSSTPVLHIGWVKPLVMTISKFHPQVRCSVDIKTQQIADSDGSAIHQNCDDSKETHRNNGTDIEQDLNNVCKSNKLSALSNGSTKSSEIVCDHPVQKNGKDEPTVADSNNNSNGRNTPDLISALASEIETATAAPHPSIAALAAHCAHNILNPDYLLGGQHPPFSSRFSSECSSCSNSNDAKIDCRELLSTQSNGSPFPGMTIDSIMKADSPIDLLQASKAEEAKDNKTNVTLRSRKMMGLKELLLAEKLNSSAIELHLTAQSQVQVSKRGRHGNEPDLISAGRSTKRSRRN